MFVYGIVLLSTGILKKQKDCVLTIYIKSDNSCPTKCTYMYSSYKLCMLINIKPVHSLIMYGIISYIHCTYMHMDIRSLQVSDECACSHLL